jgi:hypothetical protein
MAAIWREREFRGQSGAARSSRTSFSRNEMKLKIFSK